MPVRLRSIGQVLAALKVDFPDISISKIRFLESEGLVSPERAPSGYRRYADSDVERLRYILDVQKNHYLPLKVIREHLEAMDAGQPPPVVEAPRPAPPEPASLAPTPVPQLMQQPKPHRRPIRLTRRELLDLSGLSEATLLELERQLLITPRRGTAYYGRDALTIAVVTRKLSAYGMDARHLRVVKQAAEREAGLIEQAISPYLRRSGSAQEVSAEVMQLVMHAHAAVLRTAMSS